MEGDLPVKKATRWQQWIAYILKVEGLTAERERRSPDWPCGGSEGCYASLVLPAIGADVAGRMQVRAVISSHVEETC